MKPKPPTSYAAFALDPAPVAPEVTPLPPKPAKRTLKENAAHVMTYIHPEAAKALKRYAVENNCKVHDLCIEAFESWFRAHGLREQVRVETKPRTQAS